jgi:hypothetical protein
LRAQHGKGRRPCCCAAKDILNDLNNIHEEAQGKGYTRSLLLPLSKRIHEELWDAGLWQFTDSGAGLVLRAVSCTAPLSRAHRVSCCVWMQPYRAHVLTLSVRVLLGLTCCGPARMCVRGPCCALAGSRVADLPRCMRVSRHAHTSAAYVDVCVCRGQKQQEAPLSAARGADAWRRGVSASEAARTRELHAGPCSASGGCMEPAYHGCLTG